MLIHDRATPLTRRRTPEGFLQMRARIGRAGLHDYRAGEIGGPVDALPDQPVRVYRPPAEVFDAASLASFAGKPVTLDHPPSMVDSGNWKTFAVGHAVGPVERDGDHLATELVVTDAAAVSRAEEGSELSNGYWADFDFTPGLTPEGQPYDALQRNIRGNHIALVDQGRCGPSCTVGAGGTMGAGDALPPGDPLRHVQIPVVAVQDCPPIADLPTSELERLRTDLAARDRTLEARDGEIAALRARAAADAVSLDRRAAERVAVIDAARTVLGPAFDPNGLDLGEIRRAVLTEALGPDAVRGRGDDYVTAAFDTLAALRAPTRAGRRDPLAGHLAAHTSRHPDALRDRDAFLASAWKPDLTYGDR